MNAEIRTRVPRKLRLDNRSLVLSGPGNNQGGFLYLDHVRAVSYEFFFGKIFRTGRYYAVAHIANNPRIGNVRVDHSSIRNSGPARIGDIFIIGPLTYHADGYVREEFAWKVGYENHMGPTRRSGFISRVASAGTFGTVTDSETGENFFVHRTQLRDGLVFIIGNRCTFTQGDIGRGPAAFNVRPAY